MLRFSICTNFLCIFLLVLLSSCGDENPIVDPPPDDGSENGSANVHFTLDYADDIKSNELFNTEKKREEYKSKSLTEMESIFNDFHSKFSFQPEHQIHVTISETINGATNIAYTTKSYNGFGHITKLSMHFPYSMFDNKFVKAHELTHAFIAPFFLPTWADEGFAVLNENYYTDEPVHPVFENFKNEWRTDRNSINAVQNWTEGKGIYSDLNLTLWCYSYSHTIVKHIEDTWPGTFSKVFESLNSHTKINTEDFIAVLDKIIIDADMVKFFKDIGFDI